VFEKIEEGSVYLGWEQQTPLSVAAANHSVPKSGCPFLLS